MVEILMRLEQITLHGFKSFAERTAVKVLPGITGIVGPNGCGKSNIAEAVRWALGEQSAKSLRGHRMEDLVFHGSASRKAVGMAEVDLVFSNDGTLAVPWTEIEVTRRLYRTGESEYLVNRTSSRLRDILDLFAGTGANPRAYSIMDQDKLNHVLTAKPHERRLFIEEAAGIARYKQQRHETEGKLSAARQNLVRVRDVMDEVKRQLGSIERQARRATQYKALEAERRELAVALLAADHAQLTAEGDRLAATLGERRSAEEALRTGAAQLAAQVAAQRVVVQESEHRLSDLRQAVQKVQGEVERLLERREQLGVQRRELLDEDRRLAEDLRVTAERLETIGRERLMLADAAREAEAVGAERARVALELEARVAQEREDLAADRDRLEAQRQEQIRLVAERTDLMRSAGELRERGAQLARRRERLAGELADVEAELQRLIGVRGGLQTQRDRAAADLAALEGERAGLAAAVEDHARHLAETERRLAEARVALAARRSSLDAIRDLARAREGYGAGVRAVFGQRASAEGDGDGAKALPGVVGTVADLLEVPAGLERAVEAVLGERLQWVVVESFEDARAAVTYLRAHDAGTATFLPLDHLPRTPDPVPDDNGVRWAARSVTASREGLARYLLGRVAIVDHLDHAEALWRRNGVVATYVTPTGEVLGPTGRLRGGADESGCDIAEQSLLARKRRLRELGDEADRLARDVEREESAARTREVALAGLRDQAGSVDGTLRAREGDKVAVDKDFEQAVREQERLGRHGDVLRLELAQVAAESDQTTDTLAGLERRLELAHEAETRHETTMGGLRAAIESAREREAALSAELTACRVELAAATERVEALGRERTRLHQMEADLTERRQQAQERGTQLRERARWLTAEGERADEAAQEAARERDRMEGAVRDALAQHDEHVSQLSHIEAEGHRVDSALREQTAAIHDCELRATEGRVRREELVQEARRTYAVEDEASLQARHDPALDLAAARERCAALAERLQAIGPVNLVADEEYRELDERLAFLRTQHEDLTASIKDLEKALRGMTRTAQERFNQAFAEINAHFQGIFGRLFEGGRAELHLVEAGEGEDPLESGVELMAQPRGKRLQSVTLMSGGERALTGLALLFAIFYYRPSPFCVLDEVDAPLDDANIHRFLRVLRELTSQTQFLVITHNRKTMEAADALYGVTMEEPGLSKVVSVNLRA
jgi:chromosome segregation protein